MPPLPAAPNVAKIQLRGTYGEDVDVLNTFHCLFTGSPAVADCNNWALAVTNAWVAHIQDLVAAAYVLNDVTVTDLTSSTGAEGSNVANHAGTATGAGMSAGVAMVIQHQISRRYRGGHPRQYICGVAATSQSGENQWSTSAISAWEAAYTLYMTANSAFSSANVTATTIVSLSYVSGHTWAQDIRGNWHRIPTYRTSPIHDVVNDYIVNPVMGSMRRRNEQP